MLKHVLVILFIVGVSFTGNGQVNDHSEDIYITHKWKKISVQENQDGSLQVNVSPQKVRKYRNAGFVRYSNFGAAGDGKTDDINNIAATHAFANKKDLDVKADDGFTYYIGGSARTAVIRTDTDFGSAAFIIDDTEAEDIKASVFSVSSSLQPYKLSSLKSLKRNQEKIDVQLPESSLITVVDSNKMRYIRYGRNQNNGAPQTDIFVVDKNGNVDMDAPVIWDFDNITDVTVLPIDKDTLLIKGGHFTTIANKAESKYTYYSRNIQIRRSNVFVDGLEHHVNGEGDHGAPYSGFINISQCAYVTIQNTILTGRKTYGTIGSAGKPVSMGSYDFIVNRAINVSFIHCTQTNDINNRDYWGIMGSNYSKNLLYDHCTLSRFDAHMGVANASIRNSTLGYMGINAIGTGTFTVENSTIRGRSLINLRSDYGSTWQGEFIIRNCKFIPAGGRKISASLINGYNSGQHDFGYTCYMPERIIIENLFIDDSNHPEDYQGPAVFSNFNPEMTDNTYKEKFPYITTKEVVLKNVTAASGKKLRKSNNQYMFRNVELIRQ